MQVGGREGIQAAAVEGTCGAHELIGWAPRALVGRLCLKEEPLSGVLASSCEGGQDAELAASGRWLLQVSCPRRMRGCWPTTQARNTARHAPVVFEPAHTIGNM
jgi:hypothetical protein